MTRAFLKFLARRHAGSLVLCAAAPALIGLVVGLVYPSYSGLRDTLQAVARPFQKMFFGDQLDIFSASGAFTLPFRHPLSILALALGAAIPSLNSLALERERGGLDLLLSTPLTRVRLVRTLGILHLPAALLFLGSSFGGAYFGARLAGVQSEIPWGRFACLSLQFSLLHLWYAGLALWMCVRADDRNQAGRRFAVLVFAIYLVAMAAEYWKSIGWLKWVTPLGWFDVASTVQSASLPILNSAMLLCSALLLFAIAMGEESRRRRA